MQSAVSGLNLRKSFGKIGRVIDIPNLIDIQKRSYEGFLQSDIPPEDREDIGLQAVFKSVFPIKDFNENASLEFVQFSLEKPKYDVQECHQRGMTYSAPMKVVIRLVVWELDADSGTRSLRDVKEQEVYFGEIPIMTEQGTFIINGTERVVVSQLHRSPGVFFDHDKGKTQASGKILYSCRVIPYRGSWLDFEFDAKDIIHVRIDRRRKLPATVLLRALGFTPEQLLGYYYDSEIIYLGPDEACAKSVSDMLQGTRASSDITTKKGDIVVKRGKKITKRVLNEIKAAGIDRLSVDVSEILGKVIASDIVDESTGEVLCRCNDDLTEELLATLREAEIGEVPILYIDNLNVGPYLRNTLVADRVVEDTDRGLTAQEVAIEEIYRRLRPGDPPTMVAARNLFMNLFFNAERYDLSKVGRLKLNHKFSYSRRAKDFPEFEENGWSSGPALDHTVLTKTDILESVRYLIDLKDGVSGCTIDDIDHLGNRRVRAVGELMENQYRIGLVRMERAIKERMSMSQELETLMPHDLVNAKPVSAVVKEYFGSSQLSQFMDQTNPLSEVTHKRRLSALGPGGLTRERAGFEVRDVHPTHYGRICPIETPEGPNIGLIASLSTFARVNDFGFVETPYRKVEGGRATLEVNFYSALDEQEETIAQANARLADDGQMLDDVISCRARGEFMMAPADEVTLMDVSPNQLVSVAASLIPFLENDDANRALMGSNMQRQAVPLLKTRAPLVGTGIERIVAQDSGVTLLAKHTGKVESVDASRIVIKRDTEDHADDDLGTKPDIYNLVKFQRSNQNTCINQKPMVRVGDRVNSGDVIADGPATQTGELALGQNVLVAFMPWGGYNFEDSILLSERMVKDDVFTSIHIEEFECIARDTKLGKEEITRDIPNVGEEALKDQDESGIVRIGAEVQSGDVLVGKITPKGETQLSPEEKLLRAIFGEKAGDVRDTSLRVPPGVNGTVIGAKIFSRKGADKDERTVAIEDEDEARLLKDQNDEIKIIREAAYERVGQLLGGKVTAAKVVNESGKVLVPKGTSLDGNVLAEVPQRFWGDIALDKDADTEDRIERILESMRDHIDLVKVVFQDKIAKIRKGDELPPGVIKMVKVYVAIKRKLQVGDKMAGRHGNKGVVSQILANEDMPFLADGTPVDIVLNPLGVPSRMNVGQVLETHLGWAAKHLGEQVAELVRKAWDPKAIKAQLKRAYDSDRISAIIDGLDDDGLRALCHRIRHGLHLATPVFDGASTEDIRGCLERAGLPLGGQTDLYDGRSGAKFDHKVTVGVMYILKLHHLVDDKIHARSIGPYSLVTQQPLGGKAQFGGQRLGEMEVWALEAYGAAYALQEFLTVKSDDVVGRTRMYEAIVKGENTLESGLPESFNVLMKELQSLALDVQLIEAEPAEESPLGAGAGTGTAAAAAVALAAPGV
jgi:DNA-directed RNA polymerase subunit beta